MITLTDEADIHLSSIISENGYSAILLSVKGGGCSGFTYDWKPLDNYKPSENDIIIELDSGVLILDGMSVLYLAGMEVDYKKDLFGQRLMVENPNVKSMCGCGESFNVEIH